MAQESLANRIAFGDRWKSVMPATWSGVRGAALSTACLAVLLGLLLLEVKSASYVSVGALAVIPVAAAAWLLDVRGAMAIAAFAVFVRAVGVASGGIDVLTAVVETVVLVAVAIAISQAGEMLMRWRESEIQMRAQGERLAVLAERERIASQAYDDAIHALIGTTHRLQSAATVLDEGAAKQRVAAAIGDLDHVIVQLRRAILKPEASPPSTPP